MIMSPFFKKKRTKRTNEVKRTGNCVTLVNIRFTWLEDLVDELCDDIRDKSGISVGEERHRRHKRPTIEVDHILNKWVVRAGINRTNMASLTTTAAKRQQQLSTAQCSIIIKTGFVVPWYKRTLTVDFFLSFFLSFFCEL